MLILPWNLRDEIIEQMAHVRDWGGRFVVADPDRRRCWSEPRPRGAPRPPRQAGAEMHALMRELFPFCRSLTGDGVRQTFDVIERDVPLERTEVPSGTQVYDWTLPREWNIRGARLDGPTASRSPTSPTRTCTSSATASRSAAPSRSTSSGRISSPTPSAPT